MSGIAVLPRKWGLCDLRAGAILHGVCRVFIADDVESMRVLWRLHLEEDPAVRIVGEAADGSGALEGVEATRPDVLVLDLSMPNRDGLEVIPVVRTASPGTAIVVASGFASTRMAPLALRLGADAYFEKGRPATELLDVVRRACAANRGGADDQNSDAPERTRR